MELIDNVNKTLKYDILVALRSGSKVTVAASCFSIYAFYELKQQLGTIDELRFIFTSPSFVTDKIEKQMYASKQPRRKRELFDEIKKLKSLL